MPAEAEWFGKPFADHFRCVIVAPEAVKIEVVTQVSSLRKLGAFARVAADYAGRNRTVRAFMGAVTTTARSFAHAWHQLWLEVTGTVFLSIAVFGAAAMVREYTKYHAGQTTAGRVAVLICFTVVFAWFGLSSFWRVKRKGRAG
jgi:hypothetical protein